MKPTYGLDPKSIEKDTTLEFFTGTGPGGQRRNRRHLGVRLHHIPSGIIVHTEDTRSQAANRKIAFERLTERLLAANKTQKERIPTEPLKSAEEVRIHSKHLRARTKERRRKPTAGM